jgi:hypothetical protein
MSPSRGSAAMGCLYLLLRSVGISIAVSLAQAGWAWHRVQHSSAPPGAGGALRPADVPGWPLPRALFGRRAFLVAYGYPFGSLASLYLEATAKSPAAAVGIPTGREYSALPWRPKFAWPVLPSPGLLLDMTFYGGLIWAWEWSRRRARARDGQCPDCGYGPWHGAGPCPECGAAREVAASRPSPGGSP